MREKNRESVKYSSSKFFENGMNGHTAVRKIRSAGKDIYEIERTNDRPSIRVLIADIYIAGEADIYEINPSALGIDCIVLVGFYNKYSSAAKDLAKHMDVGLYTNREFFGAVNLSGNKFLNYEPKKED